MTTFLHTADWQLGKPFGRIDDPGKRSQVRQARLQAIGRIGEVAAEHGASFVLVAGDLFDTPTADRATVSAACSAIGQLGVSVYAIPGNHDHGGPGGLWEQDFFQQECRALSPNFHILTEPEALGLEDAILFPCPLLRRHETTDTTAWIRAVEPTQFGDKPRIVLAHGSVHAFESGDRDAATNQLDLQRLPVDELDYLALGDWHGTKEIDPKAWYAGTPEPDRFARGEANDPGNVLIVTATRGSAPEVKVVRTATLGWHQLAFRFTDDDSLDHLEGAVTQLVGNQAGRDLLRLELGGSLGIAAAARLDTLLETWRARLLRVKLSNQTTIAPSDEEIERLTARAGDPLISRVASRLVGMAASEGDDAEVARIALRELHAACPTP